MKKINQYLKSVVFAAFATMWSAAALGDGDIYEFHPSKDFPCNTAATASSIVAGDTIKFTLRLVNHNYAQPQELQHRWEIYCKDNGMSAEEQTLRWAAEPLCLGIVVNGKTEYAEISFPATDPAHPQVAELKCTYTVKYGDFAMPVRLATDAYGKPVDPGYDAIGFDPATNSRYFFATKTGNQNLWGIRAVDMNGEPVVDGSGNFVELQPYRWSEEIDFYVEDSRNGCYDLINFDGADTGYYVKTVDFDPDQEHMADADYWRVVHEDTMTVEGAYEPYLELTGVAPEKTRGQKLYIWSDNEKAVFPAASADVKVTVESIKFPSEEGARAVKVAEIALKPGATKLPFKLQGAPSDVGSGEGQVATLYLSAKKSFTYLSTSGLLLEDYRTVRVKCGGPLPSSMRITATDAQVTADEYYKISKTTLAVAPNGDPFEGGAYKVKVVPSLTVSGAEADEWKKYVRISTSDSPSAWTGMDDIEFTFAPGETTAKLVYVFVLGGDEKTTGLNFIRFTPVIDSATYPEAYDFYMKGDKFVAADLTVNPKAAAIVSPADQSVITEEITARIPFSFSLKITDTYANYIAAKSADDVGYTIQYKTADKSDWTQLAGLFKFELANPGDVVTGYLKQNGADPKFVLNESGSKELQIQVIPPSGTGSISSDAYKLFITVDKPATIICTVNHGDSTYEEYTNVNEDMGTVRVMVSDMSRANREESAIYAFLLPNDEETAACVKNQKRNIAFPGNTSGMKILPGQTISSESTFQIDDGADPDSTLDFSIVLCKTQKYDEAQLVDGYQGGLTIYAKNVLPQVWEVDFGGIVLGADDKGSTLAKTIPLGVMRTIQLTASECKADLDDKSGEVTTEDQDLGNTYIYANPEGYSFYTEVRIQGADGENKTYKYYGDPSTRILQHTFNGIGIATITIRMRDKDMPGTKIDGTKYTFSVEVSSKPSVVVQNASYSENAVEQGEQPQILLSLTTAPAVNIKVGLKLSVENDDPSNPSILVLGATRHVRTPDEDWDYEADIAAGRTEPTTALFIDDLDGTKHSRNWKIEAFVITTALNPQTHQPWSDFYDAGQARANIANVAPTLLRCSLGDPATTTNAIPAQIGKNQAISWAVTDNAHDLAAGLTVQWSSSDTGAAAPEIITDDGDYSYVPEFRTSGSKTVTCTIKDKDGDSTTYTWKYEVTPAKTLTLIAHGPSGGNAGVSYSTTYSGAPGLGEGHIWADGNFTGAEAFQLSYLCNDRKTVNVGAWGYGVNDVDNGSLNYGRDEALNEAGRDTKTGPYYTYSDWLDSFRYAWITKVIGGNGGGGEVTCTVSPEKTNDNALNVVTLPDGNSQGQGQNGGGSSDYPETVVEAIFAKELYPADNCGDINQDGIPDLWIIRYPDFGVYNTTDGTVTDDLKPKASFNDDGDFLPAGLTAPIATFTGLAADMPEFHALLEIRGYGDGLNDAAVLAGVSGVESDRRYTNPLDDDPADPQNNSTLSYVEWLAWQEYAAANGLGVTNPNDWKKWSPECPSDPTLVDTDNDGFADGFEYYFWYRAHVGYLDANGNHRYQTGRRFDPRNPGEGVLITSKEIEMIFNPRVSAGQSALTQDTDNDGLPDLIEFYLGTNPVDFDTDGDGLPDGWEIMIAGTDPLKVATYDDATLDTSRNTDGDAMAITSAKLEEKVQPLQFFIQKLNTVALVDPNGDTDGVQWYATKEDIAVESAEISVTTFKIVGDETHDFATREDLSGKVSDGRLLVTLDRATTFTLVKDTEDGAARGYPFTVLAGTHIEIVGSSTCAEYRTTGEIEKKAANACWIYGKGGAENLKGDVAASANEYGCLALARHQAIPAGQVVCAMPSDARDVAYLHYFVYQEFGFDPRTAWSAKSPLASRWGRSIDGQTVEGVINARQGGYTGSPTRTRAYRAYDEFLVYSFFLNNGCDMSGVTPVTDNDAPAWARAWAAFTTNPQGPGDELFGGDGYEFTADATDGKTVATKYYGRNDANGADTDKDGVPDGWELYVMAGPRNPKTGEYVMAPAYSGFDAYPAGSDPCSLPGSYFSPFVASANKSETSNQIYLGGQGNDDGLNELREFSGTDSCAYYVAIYEKAEGGGGTILPREQQTAGNGVYTADDSKWLNKFLPTDPWSADTDGDGLNDGAEGSAFVYGTPADDGKLWSIPGGGLNPCSVDTDLDGLPDGWEQQFAGTKESLYTTEKAVMVEDKAIIDFAKDADGNEIGNALQGLTDGMDGTVADAFTYPIVTTLGRKETSASDSGTTTKWTDTYTFVVVNGARQCINRDYDHDGLENWQEYLVGTMRCWRYDDPLSSWSYLPSNDYWYDVYDETDPTKKIGRSFDAGKAAKALLGADATEGDFWYETLVNKKGKIYNPFLVMDTSVGGQYFTRVENGWDCAFIDASLSGGRGGGAYYYFKNRIGNDTIANLWANKDEDYLFPLINAIGGRMAPAKYISCSPLKADTDNDGMDDYYELFHGMNPLLGASGVIIDSNDPCDIVYDAWYSASAGALEAWGEGAHMNYWQYAAHYPGDKTPRGNGYDFEVFPWLNGLATADPDGDDIRNQEEAIMPMINPTTAWHHTDPTPLWMTDSSYSNSLTRVFFRMPVRTESLLLTKDSFQHEGKTYYFRDFDTYYRLDTPLGPMHILAPFAPDAWNVSAAGRMNWMYSFEENEGYDTDHDGVSDYEELQGLYRSISDARDFDSPRRRQAMYFQGEERPSILQTMPEVKEQHPVGATIYPDDMEFLQFTAECWVNPDEVNRDQVILERAIWTDYSNPGDQEFMRKNFQIAIKNGRWYAKFDPKGTLANKQVEAFSSNVAKPGVWTHLAVTYNAKEFLLYVDGQPEQPVPSSIQPEYGASAVATRSELVAKNTANDYNTFGNHFAYNYKAIVVGAGFKTEADGIEDGLALDVTRGIGFGAYTNFYKGYVDEIRIWDGARTGDEIRGTMRTRFDAEMAKTNRDDFYDIWSQQGAADQYRGRYAKDGSGNAYSLPAELRYHFAFDSVFGAENTNAVARAPHGFDYGAKPPLSRPEGYRINWLETILNGYEGTVYDHQDWTVWVPNTMAHLPRLDGTTLDSRYWSTDYAGTKSGSYSFARSAEPVSFWTQMTYNQVIDNHLYKAPGSRHRFVNGKVGDEFSGEKKLFEFTGRHLNQVGDDLLPLGGAYVKYMPAMWDDETAASDQWEITGEDENNDGLPDWWAAKYGVSSWQDEMQVEPYKSMHLTAGEAYLLDLRMKGSYMDVSGEYATNDAFIQTADADRDGMYDWWEDVYGIQGNEKADSEKDPDNDGLSNYQEFLVSIGAYSDLGLTLNPSSPFSHSPGFEEQKVIDYFLPVEKGEDIPDELTPRSLTRVFKGEYLGELLTDHDFMEDWWENKYSLDYASSRIYDPWDDRDGDGWSNFAECRAFMWGGAVASDLIDRWLDGATGDANNHVLCYPRPAVGIQVMYDIDQIQDIAGHNLVVRMSTKGKRTDATFLIHGTDSEVTEAQDHVVGSYYDGAKVIHGFLNPGMLIPIDVKLHKATLSAADWYHWRCYATWEDMNKNQNWLWEHVGPYAAYRADKRMYEYIRLVFAELEWGEPIANISSDVDGHYGKIMYSDDNISKSIGTIDCYTGEYTLDLEALKAIDSNAENWVFKFHYTYKIAKNWPQTLWLSDTFDAVGPADETDGNLVNGRGRIKEGLNMIEGFIDFNNNGRYDVGEPFGIVKNVPIGWHKVPVVTLELTDKWKNTDLRTTIAAATSADEQNTGTGGNQRSGDIGELTTEVAVQVVREAINHDTRVLRPILAKTFVMDDRNYLSEADFITAKKPDLDWNYLNRDAERCGITAINNATYAVQQLLRLSDGSITTNKLATFTRDFGDKAPTATAVELGSAAPYYSDAPTFRFIADEDATAFSIQVATAKDEGAVIYDSGIQILGGRSPYTVNQSAHAFTPPIYSGAPIITNGAPILTDGLNYFWRVAVYNAKYNTTDRGANNRTFYGNWNQFQMDVDNNNRYADQPTGYGRVNVVVRYYGLASKKYDLSDLIVVEAYENADFTGQAMSQARVGDLANLGSWSDVKTANARLIGVNPGIAYVRAYIDLNNNGAWDKFEPWGYVNGMGSGDKAVFNPAGVDIGVTWADWVNPNSVVLYIEDVDWNKNEIPDCIEDFAIFPVETDPDYVASDWWDKADIDSTEENYAVEGDVMAYVQVERVLVELKDDNGALYKYLLAEGEKTPSVGDLAALYKFESCYEYGQSAIYGVGTNVSFVTVSPRVVSVRTVPVALIHNQVYREFGYNTLTANPKTPQEQWSDCNTKAFTALDKKLLMRYLAAIGYVDAEDLELLARYGATRFDYFDQNVDDLALTRPEIANELWAKYSLMPGDPDCNRDGIPDGWQLYTMFGPEGQVAKATPWTASSEARHTTEGGELTYVQEWNGGDYPTDPWQLSTFKDTYVTDEGTFVISDKDAYAYHLKGKHKYEDADNDGLINYEEYVDQFNGGYALNVDSAFTFHDSSTYSALTGQVVPDYFLKALQTPKYYLGFKHTSHDFIESWWKDSYSWSSLMALNKEPRKFFMPYDDPDGDGWDNWSEARASTDPTSFSHSGLDGAKVIDYPVPNVVARLSLPQSSVADKVVIQSFLAGVPASAGATWTIGGEAGSVEKQKFVGFYPGKKVVTYFLSPGRLSTGTVILDLRDQIGKKVTTTYADGVPQSPAEVVIVDTGWMYCVNDRQRADDPVWGDMIDYHGKLVGKVNYVTGEVTVDFGELDLEYAVIGETTSSSSSGGSDGAGAVIEKRTRTSAATENSYFRFAWSSSLGLEGATQVFYLSDADEGQLRQGYTKFIAFADANGNGEYDPGEPFGMANDVDVGWHRVTDLKIALATTTPVLPRFDPKALDKAAKLDDGSGGLSNAVAQVIAGKPVIVDVTPDTYVRVVRWTINDEECKHRVILSKKLGAFEAVTEADVLSKTVFDLDWKHLEKDAHDSFFALNEIDKIVYAVFVGDVARTEENVNGWIVKKFPHNRANATPVAPTAADTAIVNATRPEFEFKVPEGYPSYAFELINATGKVVFCSTNLVTAKNAAGHVVYQPPVYFGAEAEDLVNHLLPTGRYSWSVAMLNAKFRETKGGWCTAAEFDVQMAKGKVHDTDKGILEVAVRYYGEAEISTEHPIIVQAFRSADFTGVPAAQAVITDKAGVFCIYDDTNTVNVAMYGLVPGDYYVRAFIDTTNDVVRSTWESWGYQNNVGTGRADLYTPISTKVERNVISSALVFIEDMDTNNDGKPDCLQPFKPDDGHPHDDDEDIDSDGDGLTDDEEEEIGTDPYDWDTDGDGMPDGWEEWAGTDPLTPDADYVVPDDVMAYEEVEMWLITLEDGTQLLLKDGETVPKPGDSLANYGEAFYVPYWYGAPGGDGIYGRGQPTAAPTGAMVNGDGDNNPRKVPVALVHDQVYDEFGFDPNTAVPGGTIHTKDFTALDKYLLLRYREMMGSNYWADGFDPSVLEGDDYDDIEDYVNQKKLWPDWTLKPGYPDNDAQPTNPENGEAGVGDGIGDGWELFTHHNPWNYFDRNTDDDGDGVTLLDEYDYDPETGKANPTDPRNIDTDGDGVTDDLYHKYLLHDPAGDKDGDGLSNYAEYLITEVFKYDNLDPRNPTTDGHCVDYFRKLGDLYLGEIFTDHDQVGDDWEGVYNDVANRYIYNPDLDIDEDGWSNYAEFRADTNPRDTGKLGVTDSTGVTYVHPEYPVPVIEAKVVYNGHGVNLENVVFKAWSEKSDPDMTSAPDAIWTLPTIASDDSHVLVGSHKYLDLKPVGEQRYLLYGGDAAKGSIQIKVLNRYYTHVGIATTNDAASATNNVQVSKVGDPNQASWYLAARDVNGAIITLDNRVIGSVDYGTGVMVIDFSALSGPTVGDPSSGAAFADSETLTDGGHDYDLFSLDDAVVLLNWSAVKVGVNPAGIYFLGEADGITKTSEASSGGKSSGGTSSSGGANRHHGWVREGRNTFICFVDTDGDGNYSAGELYGFARGVDVGWQGAKFEVELTESSPVFARVNINDGSNDRVYYWGADSGDVDYTQVKSNDTQVAAEALSGGIYNHVRIVPYAIGGTKTDTALYDRGFVDAVLLLQNRVVAEFDVNSVDKPYITEADFIKNGKFDIDWDLFDTREFAYNDMVIDAVGDVTAVKYRIVLGKEGPIGPESNLDTTTVVRAFSTLIERRYEPVASRTLPTGLKLKENILFASQPTFMWRLDESTAVDGYAASAALYGCSYTAFAIQVEEVDKDGVSQGLVYDSGVQRVPVRNREGYFVWTAPLSAGDQTALGKIFSRAGNYRWKVAMYNAKFHPGSISDRLSGYGWSAWDTFSTDVGMQQVIDDHNYSAIGVCVKYTGPEKVLENCADTTTTKGMVRIQAFTTADFSGEPVSQAFITNKASLVDTTDVTVNGMLYGLPVEGTFYIRAYIDSNGNFTKDDWESWGYAKTSVTLTPDLRAQQNVGVYIEDADTDQDWLPDAWEFVKYGDLDHENTYVDPEGKIVLKTQTYQVVKSGKANISTKLPGASLTLFQNLDAARMLLGTGDYTEDTLTAIRAAIEKNVVAKTLKITSLVVDTDKKKVVMTVNGEVADSIAGQILSPVYILPESSIVTLRLYKKNSLVEKEWTKVKDYEVTVSTTLKTTVEVPMPDVDFSAGFYKIEVVQ